MIDIVEHNRMAWKNEVEKENQWTIPVSTEEIINARKGNWNVLLTPTVFVPKEWFGNIQSKKILCLASGGGQQGPLLAAVGANVTVFDNCIEQLNIDKMVANRDNLNIETIQGDMKDLSCFADKSFDLIFHPVSNCFIDNPQNVWNECNRVLKNDGILLAGFCNPIIFIFDLSKWDKEKKLEVKYKIPYSDIDQLPKEDLIDRIQSKETLEFGHSLESQIGGQLNSGFIINGFYEDISNGDLLNPYIKTFIATRAVKKM